jgi:hypothetical protein
MRSKPPFGVAAGARLSVTNTIGTRPPHGAVVFFDFAYSSKAGQFDTQISFLLDGRSEDRASHGSRSSLFCAQSPPQAKTKGGVPDRIYPSGVRSGIRGGPPSGQFNPDSSRLFRSRNPGRRIINANAAITKAWHISPVLIISET